MKMLQKYKPSRGEVFIIHKNCILQRVGLTDFTYTRKNISKNINQTMDKT